MTSEKTKHNFENIGELVDEFSKTNYILDYYPFGKKIMWKYWLCGTVNLKNEYRRELYKNLTDQDIILRIISEVGRAMNYLTVHADWNAFDHQRLEAFALWHLLMNGEAGWYKEPTIGKTTKQIIAMEKKEKNRIDRYYGRGRYGDDRQRAEEKRLRNNKEYRKAAKAADEEHRKTYGIFLIKRFPLMQFHNTRNKPMIHYSRKELCAINLLVDCAFENLC